MKNRTDLVASAMRHKSITLLLVAVMMLAGVFSLAVIPKDEFPQFQMPVGLVVGIYPGASEQEVEQQLAKPMEEFLWTFKEINRKRTTSHSYNDICVAMVFVKPSVKAKTEFWNKMKERLPVLKAALPSGVLGVVANDDFGDSSAMLVTLESDEKTYREMAGYVDALSDRLREVKSLANIIRMGGQKEQLTIYLDRDRLSMYGINTAMLMSRLSGQTGTLYTGSLDDGQLSRPIHVQSSLNTENDVAQTIVSSDPSGLVVRLGDIATIKREYPAPSRYIKNNGRKCILLSLQMTQGNNIVEFGDEVKAILDDYAQTLPRDVHINVISDQSQVVGDSIMHFLTELLIAILSVIVVVMLMLPLRVAGVAVMTIPITVFASIALFLAFGVEINTVTLAALVVSLGMIVDDSVVVVDCYLDKLDAGAGRWKAAVASAREFVKSIITATLVISFTFFPLLFTTDEVLHDFLQWFPYSIAIVLTVSLLVAIFVVPIMQYQFIRKGLRQQQAEKPRKHLSVLDWTQKWYDRLIEVCFRRKRATMAVGLAGIVAGGLLMTLIPQRLMPRAERNQFAVDIFLPIGTSLSYTAQIADSLAGILRQDKRVANLTTFYGSGSPRFHATFMPQFGGTHFAQFIVNTHSDAETQGMLDDYAEQYANYFSDAQVLFRQIEYSDRPYPIEVQVAGYNLDSLRVATDSIFRRLAHNPNLPVIVSSWGASAGRLEVVMTPEEANRVGLSKSLLSLNFAMRYGGGIPVTSIWEGENELGVVIKDAYDGKQTVDDFKNIRVTGLLPTLTATPLSQVADVKPGWGNGTITRINGIRTASVFGMMGRHARVGELNRDIYKDLETLRLPEGVTLKQGGQAAMERTYRPQLYLGLEIAVVLIFFIIVFHLKSIPLTLLIMYSLGFSALGGALGMIIFRQEFGATGVLGFITLMGIITRCGIIMIDYAEELLERQGISVAEASMLSAKRRFRPVFLTSAAASMGVIPMVIKNSPLWGPMGVVISIGAFVSMLFIVTMIPVGYCMVREKFRLRVKSRIWLTPLLLFSAVANLRAQDGLPAAAPRVMTLDECIAAAKTGNTRAKDARNDILMAKEQQKYARSKYFPMLGAAAFHFESSEDLIKIQLLNDKVERAIMEVFELVGLKFDSTFGLVKRGSSVGVTMIEPLYMGGRLTNYNRLADLQVDAQKMLQDIADDEIVMSTEFLYYKVLELHELDKSFNAMEKELANIHQDAVNIYENGIVNKNDVLSVELMQDQLSALRIKTANGCRLLRRALAKYIGMADEDIDVDTTLTADIVEPSQLWTDTHQALENRTETRLLDIWVEKSVLERKIAKANMLPVVGIGGTVNYSKFLDKGQSKAIGFVGMQIPLSAFWSERHEYKRKKLEERKAQDFRQDKREDISLQIQDAYDNLESTYKQVLIAEKSIRRAEENLRIYREHYKGGLTTMTALLDAQRQQQQALTQHTSAVSEYLQAKTRYLILSGRMKN